MNVWRSSARSVRRPRRPDLPFGWLLAGTAALVVVQAVAQSLRLPYVAIVRGDGEELAVVGDATEETTFDQNQARPALPTRTY